jgi:hypothetical protein
MTLMGQGYTTVGSAIITSGWSSPGATIVNTGHVLITNGTSGSWPSAYDVPRRGHLVLELFHDQRSELLARQPNRGERS